MKKSMYKRIDRETTAWDMDAGSRRYVSNSKQMRAFRREMRKHARKVINRTMLKWD